MNKKILLVGVITIIGALLIIQLHNNINSEQTNKRLIFPEKNKIEILKQDISYIYATKEELRDLLTEADIHFKAQGLQSDGNSPVYEYADEENTTGKIPVTCVEFNYYDNEEQAVSVTLVPENPECFTDDNDLLVKIQDLHKQYAYVYVITKN